MKSTNPFLLFFLAVLFLGLYSTPVFAQNDSVIVDTINSVPPETTITVEVRLRLSQQVSSFRIPLRFYNEENLEIQCDSIHWSDWFYANAPEDYSGKDPAPYFNNSGDSYLNLLPPKSLDVWAIWWFVEPMSIKDTTLFTIYFTTSTFWKVEKPVEIDTYTVMDGPTPKGWLEMLSYPGQAPLEVGFIPGLLRGPTWVREVDMEKAILPEEFSLGQNYPNPFNPTTHIRFALPEDSWVKVEVFNILGQKITNLVDEYLTAGYKETVWDGRDSKGMEVASGIYFYRIKAEKFTDIKKMVLLK
jgi:hypothetical protein